jgi:hypothetical protein
MNFELKIMSLHWASGAPDDSLDLCLHGKVFVKIDDKIIDDGINDSWTVSTGAYRMLESLYNNHISCFSEDVVLDCEKHLLPCCGHFMFVDEKTGELGIIGCPNGVDWSVLHENGMVKLVSNSDIQAIISLDEYRDIVFRFADKIKAFYDKSSPKTPDPECDIVAYLKFWANWEQMRNGNSIKYG